TTLDSVEGEGKKFQALAGVYQGLEGTTDAHLETVLSIRAMQIYQAFGLYLGRVAHANPEVKEVLIQKSNESLKTSNSYLEKCRSIQVKSSAIHPAGRTCSTGNHMSLDQLRTWAFSMKIASSPTRDPENPKIKELQKKLYFSEKDADPYVDL